MFGAGAAYTHGQGSQSPRRQTLRFVNGYAIETPQVDFSLLDEDEDQDLVVDPSLTYGSHHQREISVRDLQPPAKEVSLKPNQLAPSLGESIRKTTGKDLDHNVLSYNAYFTEQVYESAEEDERVRCVLILYYLEDDTLMIYEKRIENSGIPQGVLLKRQPVKKAGSQRAYVTFKDLLVGETVNIYGIEYTIYDADTFTRNYVAQKGVELAEAGEAPQDVYTEKRNIVEHSKRISYAKPGRDQLKKFLANDRKVLRFYCVWDDTQSLFGERRKFSVHYFLVDDTVEVKEMYQSNSGREPFPQFMKRQRLVKSMRNLSDLEGEDIYVAEDFVVGDTIRVLGREFLIYDCDSYTRQHMREAYGIEEPEAIDVDQDDDEAQGSSSSKQPEKKFEGSDVFLGSVANLDDKAPKKNFATIMKNDGKILRFGARMISTKPVDQERRFVISFYLVDDTVGIFETPQRNSGIVGGNFLKKMNLRNAETGDYFAATDFYVGAQVLMNNYRFLITDADEYALNFMELNAEAFPMSDLAALVERLQYAVHAQGIDVAQLFAELDVDGSGKLSLDELVDPLEAHFGLTKQEVLTLVRRYDFDGDECLAYEELLALL